MLEMQPQGRAHAWSAEDLSLSPSNQKPNQTKQRTGNTTNSWGDSTSLKLEHSYNLCGLS